MWSLDAKGTTTGRHLGVLHGEHVGPVRRVRFNPRYALLASACAALVLWTPTVDDRRLERE
jgi:hypothetical protein